MDHDELVRQANSAYNVGDWLALRLIYHADARIVSVAAGTETTLTRDELMDVLEAAQADVVYKVSFERAEALSDDALVIIGRIRHRAERGFEDSARFWLWTLREGLVYRSVAYSSLDEARAGYESLGETLGIDAH